MVSFQAGIQVKLYSGVFKKSGLVVPVSSMKATYKTMPNYNYQGKASFEASFEVSKFSFNFQAVFRFAFANQLLFLASAVNQLRSKFRKFFELT